MYPLFNHEATLLTHWQVRKSRPYQSNLLLHTFSTFFKYIKDVQHDPDTPLPPSGYPKTALAIAVVVVGAF